MSNIFKSLITFLFLIQYAFAGFPPVQVRGSDDSASKVKFNFTFPNKSVVDKGGIATYVDTGNKNILYDPSFEVGYSQITTAHAGIGFSSDVIDGLGALELNLTAETLLASVTATNLPASFSGQQAVTYCAVKTAQSGVSFCSLIDGAEGECADVVTDNVYKYYVVPFVGGATSAGWKVKSSGAITGTVAIDDCYLGVMSPNFTPDVSDQKVSFKAYLSGTASHTAAAAFQKVNLDTVAHDSHGGWDAVNYKWVVPVKGCYQLSSAVGMSSIADGKTAENNINITGSITSIIRGTFVPSGALASAHSLAADIECLEVGDEIYMDVFQNDSASEAYNNGRGRTYLSAELVSGEKSRIFSQKAIKIKAHLSKTTSQSLSDGVTSKITMTAVEEDEGGMANLASSRVDIKENGVYEISSYVQFDSTAGGARRMVFIYKNGALIGPGSYGRIAVPAVASQITAPSFSIQATLVAGDYIELYANQLGTASLGVPVAYLSVTKMDGQYILGQFKASSIDGGIDFGLGTKMIAGYASFGGSTFGSECFTGTCTRYGAVGNLGSNMTATIITTGTYDVTVTGFKASSYVTCHVPAADTSASDRNGGLRASTLQADASGNITTRIVTWTGTGTAVNAFFQIECKGERP